MEDVLHIRSRIPYGGGREFIVLLGVLLLSKARSQS